MRKTSLISLILALLVVTLTVNQALGLSILERRNYKVIQTVSVSVYLDKLCRKPLTSIDWGTLKPGSTKSLNIYVKNTGNTIVTLSLSAENWNPESASKYFSLTWNYKGQKLLPGRVLSLTLTLRVSPNVSGVSSFSFDIVITGQAVS